MISRSSIPKQIEKGGKMPQGKGTYGSKKGRPPKETPGQQKKSKLAKLKEAAGKKLGKKDVNTPGEKKRGFEGYINHMVSMSKGEFDRAIKSIRAKRR